MLSMDAAERNRGQALILDAQRQFRYPDGEPLLGWYDSPGGDPRTAGSPGPLSLRQEWLDASPTSKIVYRANLPSPLTGRFAEGVPADLRDTMLGCDGNPVSAFDLAASPAFAAASLPGGSAIIMGQDGRPARLRFRWLSLTCHWAIGAVWRLYASLDREGRASSWVAASAETLFDASDAPIALGEAPPVVEMEDLRIEICHGPDGLTQYPSRLGIVKVREMRANGWRKRAFSHAELMCDGSVRAYFSDGGTLLVGHAGSAVPQRLAA